MTLCAHSARSFEGSRGPPGSPGSILGSHKLPKHGVVQNARLLSTMSEFNGLHRKTIKSIADHERIFKENLHYISSYESATVYGSSTSHTYIQSKIVSTRIKASTIVDERN